MKKILKFLLTTLAVLGIVGVGAFAYMGYSSKDGTASGLVDGKLAPCPESPNCASSEDGTEAAKLVEAFPLAVWGNVPAAVAELGGDVTSEADNYISAEFTSATFGFVDDVEFRLGEDAVHIRSASRVGYSDAGANAERVAALRAALTE